MLSVSCRNIALRTPVRTRRFAKHAYLTRRDIHVVAKAAQTAEFVRDVKAPEEQPAVVDATAERTTAAPDEAASTAPADANKFKLHSSAEFWIRQPVTPMLFAGNQVNNVADNSTSSNDGNGGDSIANLVAQELQTGNTDAYLYWSYHLGRHAFFITQAIGSLLAHRAFGTAATAPGSTSSTLLDTIMKNPSSQLSGRVAEATATFLQDWRNIRQGLYKLPWDMATPANPQYNPLVVLSRSLGFMREAVATLDRRALGEPEEVWLRSGMYPEYFSNTFHYQTDGWLSTRSAEVYEFSTEVLFLGRQDAMQRTSLLPLASYMATREAASTCLLELACGTGRFHTFIKDNYPEMQTTAADLSPFYLQKARSNMRRWKRLRQPGRDLGGVDGTGTTFLQTAAEKLDVDSDSQDVVMCVYLFHELPAEAREAAARELFRVVKPGGLLVLTDSVQLGDRPAWDPVLDRFGNFNEPHYDDYIKQDLGDLFAGVGFQCDTKYMCSASKTLSFMKPLPQ